MNPEVSSSRSQILFNVVNRCGDAVHQNCITLMKLENCRISLIYLEMNDAWPHAIARSFLVTEVLETLQYCIIIDAYFRMGNRASRRSRRSQRKFSSHGTCTKGSLYSTPRMPTFTDQDRRSSLTDVVYMIVVYDCFAGEMCEENGNRIKHIFKVCDVHRPHFVPGDVELAGGI